LMETAARADEQTDPSVFGEDVPLADFLGLSVELAVFRADLRPSATSRLLSIFLDSYLLPSRALCCRQDRLSRLRGASRQMPSRKRSRVGTSLRGAVLRGVARIPRTKDRQPQNNTAVAARRLEARCVGGSVRRDCDELQTRSRLANEVSIVGGVPIDID